MKNREKIQESIIDWGVLLVGWFLIGFQIYKYVTDALEINVLEGAVFVAGILFIFKPSFLVDVVKGIAKRKGDGV